VNRDQWRDRRIRQIEIQIVDATDQRYWDLSLELSELIAESNAERGLHHDVPIDLQADTPTPQDSYRAALRRARDEQERLADKPSTVPVSEAGAVVWTTVTNV
jgi:hypothetical protein